MTKPRLYGLGEIAEAIGVPTPIVTVWRHRGKLPEADALLRMGPVWTARTIEPWIRAHARKNGGNREHASTTSTTRTT